MSQTEKAEFHIHIDAGEVRNAGFPSLVEGLGFQQADFLPHPLSSGYTPHRHWTFITNDGGEFNQKKRNLLSIFEQKRRKAEATDAELFMDGYVECEAVMNAKLFERSDIWSKEPIFNQGKSLPFFLGLDVLKPGDFRESELHITIPYPHPHTNPCLFDVLMAMNLFVAFNEYEGQRQAIFTVQDSQGMIDQIRPPLWEFLRGIGGYKWAWAREERIADKWVSRPDYPLPPVVVRINPLT